MGSARVLLPRFIMSDTQIISPGRLPFLSSYRYETSDTNRYFPQTQPEVFVFGLSLIPGLRKSAPPGAFCLPPTLGLIHGPYPIFVQRIGSCHKIEYHCVVHSLNRISSERHIKRNAAQRNEVEMQTSKPSSRLCLVASAPALRFISTNLREPFPISPHGLGTGDINLKLNTQHYHTCRRNPQPRKTGKPIRRTHYINSSEPKLHLTAKTKPSHRAQCSAAE